VEDHFTQIDLAANSGHYLGHDYNPKRLRALRRFTIHRMFKLLDVQPTPEVTLWLKAPSTRVRRSGPELG
jgi:hypothetical protein